MCSSSPLKSIAAKVREYMAANCPNYYIGQVRVIGQTIVINNVGIFDTAAAICQRATGLRFDHLSGDVTQLSQCPPSLEKLQECSLAVIRGNADNYPASLIADSIAAWDYVCRNSDAQTSLGYIGVLWRAAYANLYPA